MAVLREACGLSYVAGAPRHKQRGAVFELRKEGKETNFVPVLEGEQVLLEKDPRPRYYRWGSGGPSGKGVGSRAHSGLGTQPGQNSGRTQPPPRLCVSERQLVSPVVGDQAVHPVSCVILVNKLIWSDPNLVVQEEQEQRSSFAEGSGGGGVRPRHSP